MKSSTRHLSSLLQALQDPAAYPHPVGRIELGETHVSYLFFTGNLVYKVKKPVAYGFLDFTSLESRRHYCRREVELNSRISPEVYLGVSPICERDGTFRIDPPGPVVEYAVKMIQLDRNRSAGALLQGGGLSRTEVRRMADRIAEFHATAASGPEITRLGDLETVKQNTEENFRQTEACIGVSMPRERYEDLRAYTLAFLEAKESVFRERAGAKRIRDGHGDLHLGNIFLDDGIKIIDCIEFNDRFRCLDVSEDIAFTAMDLDFYGREDLSRFFVDRYVEAATDPGVRELLNFFKVYRAQVRGKVLSFQLGEPNLDPARREALISEASRYFSLAHRYVRRIYERPLLVLVAGLMASGKSRLGMELSQRWGMELISSDATRKQMAGLAPRQHRFEGYGEGIYSPEFSLQTYRKMFDRSAEILSRGGSVLLDATFRNRDRRREILSLGARLGAETFLVECRVPESVARLRLGRRKSAPETTASDGRWELYPLQKAHWEPIEEVPAEAHIVLDTTPPPAQTLPLLLKALLSRLLERGETGPRGR